MANIQSLYFAEGRMLKWGDKFYSTPTPDIMDGLYSWYNADGNTNDSTGNYNATTAIVGYTTGKIGQAFQMNGLTNRVELPTNSHLFTGDFSVSLWLNVNVMATAYPFSNYTTTGNQKGFVCGYTGTGTITFGGWFSGLSVSTATSPNGTLTTGVWNHIVWVYTANSGIKIYKNGSLVATGSSSSVLNYNATTWPVIGANHYNGLLFNNYVDGNMDMIGTWNKALIQNEIDYLYNAGVGRQII